MFSTGRPSKKVEVTRGIVEILMKDDGYMGVNDIQRELCTNQGVVVDRRTVRKYLRQLTMMKKVDATVVSKTTNGKYWVRYRLSKNRV